MPILTLPPPPSSPPFPGAGLYLQPVPRPAAAPRPASPNRRRISPMPPADASIPAAGDPSAETARIRELALRIAAGDPAAESELIQTFSRGLFYFLQRQGKTREQADDLHQEVFRIALERLRGRGIDDPAAVGAFLRGVAVQLMRGEWRKDARRKTDADEDAVAVAEDRRDGALPELLRKERAALVRRAISELPIERDRLMLHRFYVAEESRDAICGDLGLDAAHFHRVLFRARLRFKELFEELCQSAAGAGHGPN